MKSTAQLALALLAAVAIPCQAQWYVGGSAGEGRIKANDDRTDQFFALGFDDAHTSFDKQDTAYRAFGGYRLHRYLAVELGVSDLGEFKATTDVLPAGRFESRDRITGLDASVLGLLPLGDRVTLFARGGVIEARTRASFSGTGSVLLKEGVSSSAHKSSPLYGAGAMVRLAPRWDLRLDWTRYRRVGSDTLSDRFDLDSLMLGVAYRF